MKVPLVNRDGVTTAHTVIDDDMAHLADHRWYESSEGYAIRREYPKTIWMHRVVLGVDDSVPCVDHINSDKLDNRRENLRPASKVLNGLNGDKPRSNGTSGIRGVHWDKRRRYWRAHITVRGRHRELGRFATPEEAEAAVIEARRIQIEQEERAA
jgi:hypothetical protein